jgi:hypothetical protein
MIEIAVDVRELLLETYREAKSVRDFRAMESVIVNLYEIDKDMKKNEED